MLILANLPLRLPKMNTSAPRRPGLLAETLALVRLAWRLERRQQYAAAGLALYSLCVVFVAAFLFKGRPSPQSWNMLFWLMLLFMSVTASARSFVAEPPGQLLYTWQLARAQAVILSRMVYGGVLLAALALCQALFYSLLLGWPLAGAGGFFWAAVVLGAFGLSGTFTLVSAIAAAGRQSTLLAAVLGFPVVIPQLLGLYRITEAAILDLSPWRDLAFTGLTSALALVLGLLLFPLLWRE